MLCILSVAARTMDHRNELGLRNLPRHGRDRRNAGRNLNVQSPLSMPGLRFAGSDHALHIATALHLQMVYTRGSLFSSRELPMQRSQRKRRMNTLDLFSGVGGFSLGLERAGMHTVAFCECEPYCRAVLKRHWPHVPCYPDIRNLTAAGLGADGHRIDVMCGGFPCQDVSEANHGAGLNGHRSGLWREFKRLIGEVSPRWAIIENVSALQYRGLGQVLRDIHEIGYDAEWSSVTACAVGRPHLRERVWIVAYPQGQWREQCGRLEFSASGDQAGDIHQRRREPEPPRVADGVPHRTHRNRVLGNAVVPLIPEIIGRAIMRAEATVEGSQI